MRPKTKTYILKVGKEFGDMILRCALCKSVLMGYKKDNLKRVNVDYFEVIKNPNENKERI